MTGRARRRIIRNRLRANGNGHGGAPRWVQALVALFGLAIVAVAGAGIAAFGVYRTYANDLLPPDEVIARQPSGGAQIFDRNGELLYEFVDDKSGLRSPVKLEEISPWMIAATISTEDYSYWDNPGVNYKGLARAGLEQLNILEPRSGQSTGGSSITQQLVKNVYIDREDRYKRSYSRKIKETIYALELTDRYDKNQILEWYLNQISYGGLYNGVEAAALGYFGKSAKDLNLAEAALLAGIPASPSEYDPINNPEAARARRDQVLKLLQSRNTFDVTLEDGTDHEATRIQVNDDGTTVDVTDTAFYLSTVAPVEIVPQRFPVKAPHWVFTYIKPELERLFGEEALYSAGLRVTTTLDLELQRIAEASLERWISEFEASAQGHNGALVAIDPRTSEIVVMVGSRDYFRDDIEGRNNNAISLNSPGSTLKPFTYSAAFEHLGWGTETEILDTPVSFPDGDKAFVPRNPSGNFQGPISVRRALGNSLNIPAAKTAALVGVPDVAEMYRRFGLTTVGTDVPYGPAITLGGIDITLLDVTYGYTVFPNNGVMRGVPTTLGLGEGFRELDPVSILQVVRESDGEVLYPETDDHRVKIQERRVVEPAVAYMVNDILSDPNAFCITYGCGSLSIGREWGVKTGTSEPFETLRAIGETWTYGYTTELVAGVWAGNSDNSPMYNITSTSISYRALRDFLVEALGDVPASTFEKPGGVVEMETCTPSGMKADAECGRKVKNILADKHKPTDDDDWWSRVRIDIRDGLLATELTPQQFVQNRLSIAIPEELQGFRRAQAQEWARYLNLGTAPDERSTGNAPVRIDSPRNGTVLRRSVEITGKADSENFVAYRLEYGLGAPPLEWKLIERSDDKVTGGELGEWDIDDLPDGEYTLRLVVEDAERGELSTFVIVYVGENVRRVPARSTPTPIIIIRDGNDEDEDND
jgi:membrane peptidoglycan carboxypeptidase